MPSMNKLGSGLKTLFGEEQEKPLSKSYDAQEISIDLIFPNEEQPRKKFDEDSLKNLSQSIIKHGVLLPLLVQKKGKEYMIISGERRYLAAKKLGIKKLPVIVKDVHNDILQQIALIENLQREDLTSYETAVACSKLLNMHQYNAESLSSQLGVNRSQISNLIRVLSLPETALKLFKENKISFGHAKAIVGKPNADELAKAVVKDGLSVREVEKLAQKKKQKTNRVSMLKSGDLASLEEMMTKRLEFPVQIKAKSNHTGEVRLKFKDFKGLDSILQFLNKIS